MKYLFIIIMLLPISVYCQDINKINYIYNNCTINWKTSSKLALPYFEELYYEIEPLYNKYYLNNLELDEAIHRISRNYIRFMNEYYIKGFGGKEYIEKAWKMNQTMKSYEALKEYNTLELLKYDNKIMMEKINSTNVFNYQDLRVLNSFIENKTNNKLFLESPTIKQVQEKLKNNDIYLSFSFSLNDRTFCITAITNKTFNVYKSNITTYELFNRIGIIKGLIDSNVILLNTTNVNLITKNIKYSDNIDTNLNIIGNELNRILKNYTNIKNIIIENEMIVSQIPFDLIRSDNGILYYKKYNITYIPNASYFLKLGLNSNQNAQNILAISPKVSDKNKLIEEEITEIIPELFPEAVIYSQCSSSNFFNILADNMSYAIFHLSTHFNKETSTSQLEEITVGQNKYLLKHLSKKEGYFPFLDKKVSINDIITHNKTKAQTLILSGCETATSDDILSVLNPLFTSNVEKDEMDDIIDIKMKFLLHEFCYCNNTKSFDNLILTSMTFLPQYIIAFQNQIKQEHSWAFFNEFYSNYLIDKDITTAFFNAKKALMDLNNDGYYDYASIILIGY